MEWACGVGTGRAPLKRAGLGVDVLLAANRNDVFQTEGFCYVCPAAGSGLSCPRNGRCLDAAGARSLRKE